MTVGLKEVVAAARELGLDASLKEVPSMALGSNEVTLLDLTGAFASVSTGRAKLEPWGITAFASDAGGMRSLGAPAVPQGELPQNEQLTRLLRDVVEHGTGRAAVLNGASVAGKTGTSQDHRDAWFVGFTDDLVVGVWLGNDDRSPMKGMTGGSLPAQIWKSFVTTATPLLARSNKPEVAEGTSRRPDRHQLNLSATSTPAQRDTTRSARPIVRINRTLAHAGFAISKTVASMLEGKTVEGTRKKLIYRAIRAISQPACLTQSATWEPPGQRAPVEHTKGPAAKL